MITLGYTTILICLGSYYGTHFAATVFIMSLCLALVPFATSKWLFGLPIIWWLWACIWGEHHLALWALAFAPFHWICWGGVIVGIIKSLFHLDEW